MWADDLIKELSIKSRRQDIVFKRSYLIWILWSKCGYTMEQLAEMFGFSNHSVIHHNIKIYKEKDLVYKLTVYNLAVEIRDKYGFNEEWIEEV